MFPSEERRSAAQGRRAAPRPWSHVLGDREISNLTATDLKTFVKQRREGKIQVPDHQLKPVISEGTIGADIVFLQTALNWAVEQGLLSHNPVARFKRPKNPRPKRPVADYDRYLRVQAVADRVDPRLGVFMTLIEALGWRESAICQLRAEDVRRTADADAPFGRIRKVGTVDKKRVERWLPMATRSGGHLIECPS